MAPMPVNKNPNMTNKRQTGTVPKTTTSAGSSSTTTQANATNKSSSRKNTEIVAPTRRELNDLNDYLLSVAESTKQQNNVDHSHLDTSCFELENLNFQENQRFCWPVRPIPRRNVLKSNSDNQNQLVATYLGNCATTNPVSNTAAAIGVVIPTTPSSTIIEDSINSSRIAASNHHQSHNHHHHHHNLNQSHHHNNQSRHQNQTHSNSIAEELNGHPSNINLDSDLTWEQRLNFIQYFLSLTSKSTPNKDSFENQNLNVKMVNEIKEGEVYNSTSLEDVAHSEASDAHSVTSVHTISSPNTPTYEELQSKLEASSRNMQNIKDQQQQLLKLQQAAKQHLSDMENFRNQQKPAHFNQNGSAPPDYESVEEVQSDMSNLVNRMKALTTFIQGQHELSGLLGEDGPEILAEQQALHEKLQELRSKKLEMQNLVSELQEINNSAEASVQRQNAEDIEARVVPVEYERVVPIELVGNSTQQKIGPEVNGHFSHCNGSGSHDIEEPAVEDPAKQTAEDDEASVAIANDLIQQKMSDINAMKNQLKRLKDMMETVKQIETKAEGKSAKEIADEAVSEPERLSSTDPENRENCSKNSNSTTIPFAADEKDASITQEEEEMSERVRVLHEMTQDLRNQAVHLAVERDRLKAIKDDLTRRRDVENCVIQNKNLNREASGASLNSSTNKEAEKLRLKVEYEAKKKEFEKLCQRLESDDLIRNDEEEEDELTEIEATERDVKKEPATIYYPQDTWRSNPNASASSSVRGGKQSSIAQLACRGKESTDSGAVDVNGIASLEDNSFQSGSTRSFSMPPPMRTLSTRDTPWRKNSQDNSQSQFDHYAPPPPPLPVWNPNYYYSTPYAQQFSPHCHHHMMLPGSHLGGDYFCTPHQSLSSAVSGATGSNVATAVPPPPPTLHSQAIHVQPSAGITSNDPVLLQQFIQTQQMLINSVCQCNQLLWHQQREINNLNNAVLLLQERLLNQVGNSMPEIPSLNNRAESVPPTSVTVANGIYTSAAQRAQSEQPHPQAMLPPHPIHPAYQIMQTPMSSPMRQYQAHNFSNVCHQQQQRRNISNAQGQSQQAMSSNAAYNYTSAGQEAVFANNTCSQQQQQQHISSSSTYNNASSHQTTTGFLNNDVSHSIPLQHPAPPIFMHHHNNNLSSPSAGETGGIYQNTGANPAAAPAPNTSNAAAAAAALNNQVPPGNRANNYWDNFRSYSRQNLLSTNSCKSNEDQQQHQVSTSPFGVNATANVQANGPPNNYINVPRNLQQFNGTNSSNNSNNLSVQSVDNKLLHTFRNQFNNNATAQQFQQPQPLQELASLANIQTNPVDRNSSQIVDSSQICNHSSSNLDNNQPQISQNVNLNQDACHFNNANNFNSISTCHNSMAAILGSPDFRNMNFNFEVNEFNKKKIPFKASCSAKQPLRQSYPPTSANESNNSFQQSINIVGVPSISSAVNQISDGSFISPASGRSTSRNDTTEVDMGIDEEALGACGPSEEIKKNLLVNALKSDKFTTKFFESLKEDVYREVYTIIQATESHPHYLVQLFKELQLVSSNDPLRNVVMQAMHDLYKRSCNQETELFGLISSNSEQANRIADHGRIVQPHASLPKENTVENNNAPVTQYENNHDNEILNSLLNSQELRRLAYKIMFESTSPPQIEKDSNKPSVKESTESNQSSQTEIFRPDYELINHIMSTIRSSIHRQKIDESMILRIAKLTCNAVDNQSGRLPQAQIERRLVAPKELCRVMKTFEPNDRDSFLSRYETFLQSLFVIKASNDDVGNVNLVVNKPRDSNLIGLKSSSTGISNLSTEDVQNLRKYPPPNKTNISIANQPELASNVLVGKKSDYVGDSRVSSSSRPLIAASSNCNDNNQQHHRSSNNSHNTQPPDLITTADVALVFGPHALVNGNANEQTSPCTNNNMINEDLAEADQVCSSNNNVTTTAISLLHGDRSTSQHPMTTVVEDYLDDNQPDSAEDQIQEHLGLGRYDLGVHNRDEASAIDSSGAAEEDSFNMFEKVPSFYGKFVSSSGQLDNSESICSSDANATSIEGRNTSASNEANRDEYLLGNSNDGACALLFLNSATDHLNAENAFVLNGNCNTPNSSDAVSSSKQRNNYP